MATVVLDKSQRKATYSFATFLKNQGAAVFIDDRHAIAQNKIILIDRRVIITGSFNFTSAAESKNAENLLVITGHPELYGDYLGVFNVHGGSRTFNLRRPSLDAQNLAGKSVTFSLMYQDFHGFQGFSSGMVRYVRYRS